MYKVWIAHTYACNFRHDKRDRTSSRSFFSACRLDARARSSMRSFGFWDFQSEKLQGAQGARMVYASTNAEQIISLARTDPRLFEGIHSVPKELNLFFLRKRPRV
ncbi:uncharacterized protein PHALS_10150 [Plasmopara halstedii]|uniref:Uncharacterized protein n=1 Tax=Plasmopara halstedii TaxID=4781 RepID=A0A0P1AFN7_PLAHL|nr:uncharacterized protein PHALS_10150 [Plasmopara halstedii]CEG39924.1 hypothetical protein PHALS_10150 [Plasmopara halstedii]|eukprot:XP_024576293.1 hypothetical protein PHALS_10150 [Plasmopara halstedii]